MNPWGDSWGDSWSDSWTYSQPSPTATQTPSLVGGGTWPDPRWVPLRYKKTAKEEELEKLNEEQEALWLFLMMEEE